MGQGLYDLIYSARNWNKHARVALREELEKHHRQRIPRHFRMGAHQLYGYMPRTAKTREFKRTHWRIDPNLDLVRSGRTSRYIQQQYQITFGGQFGGEAKGGTLQGRLKMPLPFPASRPGRPGSVTLEEIKKEIRATTPAEDREIAEGYRDRLVNLITNQYGPQKKIRG